MSEVIRRPSADRDLVSIFQHYAREAGLRIADRFFAEAEATFSRLADMPAMGMIYKPEEIFYEGLRYFPITCFPKYLVFYQPLPNGIEVLRVLHGARDIYRILYEDMGIKEEESGSEI